MIEILFSESAAGSLKSAQHYGSGSFKGMGISVILSQKSGSETSAEEIETIKRNAEEKKRTEWEKAVPLGGNPDDVYCFDLAWDMGDITENGIGQKRLDVLKALYSIYDDDTQKAAKMQYDQAVADFAQVTERAQCGEDVRIWYSDSPSERCGLLWFMAQLRNIADYKGRVYMFRWKPPSVRKRTAIWATSSPMTMFPNRLRQLPLHCCVNSLWMFWGH